MKLFLTFALAFLPLMCLGAPSISYTSYFNNVHVYTNITLGGVTRNTWPSSGVSGTVINTGASTVGAVPRYTDTTGTNVAPSTVNIGSNGGVTITNAAASEAGLIINQFTGATNAAISVNTAGASQFKLYGEAANTPAFRNGTTAQELRVYATYTDASNHRHVRIGDGYINYGGLGTPISGAATYTIANLIGTGASDLILRSSSSSGSVRFTTGATERWNVNPSGHLLAATDNSWSIGARTNSRPQNGYFSGHILSLNLVESKTADYTVLSSDSKAIFTNEGTTAIRNNTLPGAAAGLTYTFIIQDSDGVTVTAAAGDTIRIAGSVSIAGGNITAATIGNTVTLVAINTTEWVATSVNGTWTVN